jgi:hypothetical protein
MAQNGQDIADDLKNTFSKVIESPLRAVSSAYDTVKSGLGLAPKPDTSWHDEMVKKANQSFKDKAASDAQKAPPKPAMPSHKNGTDFVPHTGPALLHKGEAVLKKEDADKYREAKMHGAYEGAAEELAGTQKPKKEIDHIKIRKAKSGGHIVTHKHTHPMHPDEEHVVSNMEALHDHLEDHLGEPNDGEAEADMGQHGIPDAQAQPAGIPPVPQTAV